MSFSQIICVTHVVIVSFRDPCITKQFDDKKENLQNEKKKEIDIL